VYDPLRAQKDHDDGGDLHGLVGRHALGAARIVLSVGVEVGDMKNAREQNKRDTENPQDRAQGNRYTSLCCPQTHLIMTLARKEPCPQNRLTLRGRGRHSFDRAQVAGEHSQGEIGKSSL